MAAKRLMFTDGAYRVSVRLSGAVGSGQHLPDRGQAGTSPTSRRRGAAGNTDATFASERDTGERRATGAVIRYGCQDRWKQALNAGNLAAWLADLKSPANATRYRSTAVGLRILACVRSGQPIWRTLAAASKSPLFLSSASTVEFFLADRGVGAAPAGSRPGGQPHVGGGRVADRPPGRVDDAYVARAELHGAFGQADQRIQEQQPRPEALGGLQELPAVLRAVKPKRGGGDDIDLDLL